MKFVQLNVNGQKVLFNLALVTKIHTRNNLGCRVYFGSPNSCINIDESFDEVESMLEST